MTSVSGTPRMLVLLAATVAGAFVLSYLVVGREMTVVMQAVGFALLLLLGFASVKVSIIVLVISMLLSPEIQVGSTAKRDITVRLEDVILFVLTVGWMLRMAILKDVGFMLKTPLNKPMAVYSAVAVLATGFGVVRDDVNLMSGFFFTLKIVEYFVLFSVVVNYLNEERDVHAILTVHLVAFALIVGYGLFQVASGGDVSAPFEGSVGERNTLGGYLVLMGAVTGGLLMHSDIALERKFLTALIPAAFVVLLFSISRSGWVSSMVAASVLFFSAKRRGIFVLVGCVILLAFPLVVPDVVQNRVDFTFRQALHPQQIEIFGLRLDTSTSARIFSVQLVLREFRNHALLGYGITGFQFLDGQFVRVLVETGLLGLASFLWLVAGVRRVIARTLAIPDLPPRFRGLVVGFHAGFWAMMAHAFTANTFLIVRIAEPFWCLAALTVIVHQCWERSPEHAAEPVVGGHRFRLSLQGNAL